MVDQMPGADDSVSDTLTSSPLEGDLDLQGAQDRLNAVVDELPKVVKLGVFVDEDSPRNSLRELDVSYRVANIVDEETADGLTHVPTRTDNLGFAGATLGEDKPVKGADVEIQVKDFIAEKVQPSINALLPNVSIKKDQYLLRCQETSGKVELVLDASVFQ